MILKNCRISVDQTHQFLNKLSDETRLHLDCLTGELFMDLDTLLYVLQTVHRRCGSIKKLWLTGFDQGLGLDIDYQKLVEVFASLVPLYSTLEGITIFKAELTQECVEAICDGITHIGHKVDSPDCAGNVDVESERPGQPYLPLQELDLACNNISHSVTKLSDAFLLLGCLRKLELCDCGLEERDFQTLGPALSNLSNLQHLDLRNNDIGNSLNAVIHEMNARNITHLDLGNTKLGKESKQHLFQLQLPLLEEISLGDNDIDSCDTKALSVLLKHTPQLRSVDLRGNSIGSHGATSLFQSFQHTPHLTHIYLMGNNIEHISLGSSYQSLPNLTFLNLSHNEINSDGAIILSSSFQYMPQVKEMYINDNPIGSEGLEAIFRNIHHLLNLNYTTIPPLPREKWSAKIASVFQASGENHHQTLVQACIERLKQKGMWRDNFYNKCTRFGPLHNQEIVRAAAIHTSVVCKVKNVSSNKV